MIISKHLRTAPPRRAVRIDELLRIDFKMGFGLRMNVARRQYAVDKIALAKQNAATFTREGAPRLALHRFDKAA